MKVRLVMVGRGRSRTICRGSYSDCAIQLKKAVQELKLVGYTIASETPDRVVMEYNGSWCQDKEVLFLEY